MKLKEVLNKIDRLKAELDDLRPIPADRWQRIMQKFRLDWNFHSNKLEGNKLDYGETRALLLHGLTAQGKPLKDHIELEGHNEAILLIEEIVKEERELTENFIRELHQLILKKRYQVDAISPEGKPVKKWIEVGQYKTTPNHVETKTGEVLRFATPEETPAKMHDLVEWYRKNKEELHPLLLAAQFHYKFIRIHPFDDGNGRIARILMNFILMQKGFPPVVVLTEKKDDYISALQIADGGNEEPFITFLGEQLLRSLDLMTRGARGENIEEDDDADKEFKLLLKTMDDTRSDEVIQKELTPELCWDIYAHQSTPIIQDILTKVEEVQTHFTQSDNRVNYFNRTIPIEDADDELFKLFNIDKKAVSTITWSFNLKNYRKAGFNPFSISIDITLELQTTFYSLLIGRDKLVSKLYHQKLSSEEHKFILRQFTKELNKKLKNGLDTV